MAETAHDRPISSICKALADVTLNCLCQEMPSNMNSLPPVRRIVTGHNSVGRSVFSHQGSPPTVVSLQALPGVSFHEIWSTSGFPPIIDVGTDPTLAPFQFMPGPGNTLIRVLDIPPDPTQHADETSAAAFAEIGGSQARTTDVDSRHAFMHRTQTIDYGVCIEGEVWLVLEEGETRLSPGDVVIQRGTNHAWSNRTQQMARMLFVLLDGQFSKDLAQLLPNSHS